MTLLIFTLMIPFLQVLILTYIHLKSTDADDKKDSMFTVRVQPQKDDQCALQREVLARHIHELVTAMDDREPKSQLKTKDVLSTCLCKLDEISIMSRDCKGLNTLPLL